MESHQRLVFALFMAAIQLIRESRLRPRLMDSVFNFMNVGIMISPTPMRQYVKSPYGPEEQLYTEDEWEYPIAMHGTGGIGGRRDSKSGGVARSFLGNVECKIPTSSTRPGLLFAV